MKKWLNQNIENISFMTYSFLGIYGERFFKYLFSHLKSLSPETFSFFCLICSYCVLRKVFKSIAISNHQFNKNKSKSN